MGWRDLDSEEGHTTQRSSFVFTRLPCAWDDGTGEACTSTEGCSYTFGYNGTWSSPGASLGSKQPQSGSQQQQQQGATPSCASTCEQDRGRTCRKSWT